MKHLIVLIILLVIAGLTFLVWKWPQDQSKTFSQHAAAHTTSAWYYFGFFFIVLSLMAIFFFNYFIPVHSLSAVFTIAVTLALVTQFIVAIFPETTGLRKTIHHRVVTVSVAALFVSMGVIIFEPGLSPLARTVAIVAIVVACFLAVEVIRHHMKHPRYLVIQALFYALFLTTILVATYIA